MKKIIWLVVALFVLTSCQISNLSANKNSAAKSKTGSHEGDLKRLIFDLGSLPNTNHTGLFVADALGYYRELGIDLLMIQPSGADSIPSVSSGFVQFGISSQDSIAQALSGDSKLPITAIASITENNNSGILTMEEDGVESLKDLEGKRYETWEKPIRHGVLSTLMEREGGDFNQVNLIPFIPIDEVEALRTDRVDAVWVYYSQYGVKAEVEGLKTNFIEIRDLDPVLNFYSPLIIGNSNFMKDNQILVQDFVDATKRGYLYAAENPEEAARILLEANPDLEEAWVYESQRWISPRYKGDLENWGEINPQRWSLFMQWVENSGLLAGDIDIEEGYTNEYIEN